MSNIILPAPLWRRLFAAFYDGLVFLGLCMAALLIEMLVRESLLGLPRNTLVLQLCLFLVGLGFFGGFWVHGGQTLGMRSWRLHVRRPDGAALRWPIATVRYAVMLATWAAALTPALLLMPRLATLPALPAVAAACAIAVIVAGAILLLDHRRRAPCDWIAGTEVVLKP